MTYRNQNVITYYRGAKIRVNVRNRPGGTGCDHLFIAYTKVPVEANGRKFIKSHRIITTTLDRAIRLAMDEIDRKTA